MTEFRMTWPGYTLADYIKGRRLRAKEIRAEAKVRADQIEQEMAALETATIAQIEQEMATEHAKEVVETATIATESSVQGMHMQARQGVTQVAETIAHPRLSTNERS